MNPVEPDEREAPPHFGLFWGLVTDRDDPENRGRVRAQVPGLIEPSSGWLLPCGWLGAGSQGGAYDPPQLDGLILVGFIQGDIDEGVYWPGPPGAPNGVPDVPPTVAEAPAGKANTFRAYASPSFEIYIVEDGTVDRRLVIRNRVNGDSIEMNANDNTLTLQATTALNLWATGLIDIRGGHVVIQGRSVVALKTRDPI